MSIDIAACSYYRSYVPSLTKRETSKFWVACFTDKSGRRLKRSTATTDRKKAVKLAEAFEEAARRKRTLLQMRRVIADLHRDISGTAVEQKSVKTFFEEWLARKAPETAANTRTFYRGSATKFTTFLGPLADHDLTEITSDHILRFRNEQAKVLAPKTVNHLVKFLRMVFKAAKRDALIADDPTEFVDTVKQNQKQERRPFTVDEVQSVLAVAGKEWRSMVLFGLYTGQRLADIACLTWANIDIPQRQVRLVTRKTGKHLVIPLAPPLLRDLEERRTGGACKGALHPRASAIVTAQGKSGHLSNQFADLLVQAGLRKKQAHRKTHGEGRGKGSAQAGVSFHCLRHTAVTLLKEAGIPAAVVMELVGHDSEQMSEHYTHVGDEALRKATAAFPDLLES